MCDIGINIINSKWVWPGSATITYYRPTQRTARKSQRTIATKSLHQQDDRKFRKGPRGLGIWEKGFFYFQEAGDHW